MKFQIYVDVVIRDQNGKVLQRIRKRKCKSYVRAVIDWMRVCFSAASTAMVDTGGTPRTTSLIERFRADAGAAITTHGIRVGTGTTAVAIGDFALVTSIAEGIGAGQLSHGATSVGTPSTIGSSRQFTIARTFTNNSGASITVNEVGLICNDITGLWFFLVERSLLTFAIANGSSATVTYTISVSV